MCSVKSPKPVAAPADKPLPVMRNPYLDGLDPIIRSRQAGTSALRIDRGGPVGSGRIPRPSGSSPIPGYTNTSPAPTGSPHLDILSKLPGPLGLYGKAQIKRQAAAA